MCLNANEHREEQAPRRESQRGEGGGAGRFSCRPQEQPRAPCKLNEGGRQKSEPAGEVSPDTVAPAQQRLPWDGGPARQRGCDKVMPREQSPGPRGTAGHAALLFQKIPALPHTPAEVVSFAGGVDYVQLCHRAANYFFKFQS